MRLRLSALIFRLMYFILMLMFITACALTPAATSTPIPSPTPNPTPTPEPEVDAFTVNQRIARTISIGNALEAPNEGEWGLTLKEEFFRLIHQRGFTAVRL